MLSPPLDSRDDLGVVVHGDGDWFDTRWAHDNAFAKRVDSPDGSSNVVLFGIRQFVEPSYLSKQHFVGCTLRLLLTR